MESERIHQLNERIAELERQNEILERRVNYWRIEAQVDHDRWIRALEHMEYIRSLK